MTMLRAQALPQMRSPVDDDVNIGRDRALVTQAQAGDRAAFDDLYARYYQRLWRFCLKRLGDEHEAEDVAQEAFVRAWQALPGFGGERRFYPWLSVIAAHLCTNALRKRNRSDPVADFRESHLASWENCGEEHVMVAHDWELAARAFARLSSRHRAVLELREERGWSYRRIAEHEGIGLTAVESVLWRAREALKREFDAQAGGGRLAGLAGAVLLAARRFLRGSQALVRQGSAMTPNATSLAIGSASVAASAVAAVVTTFGSLAAPPSTPATTAVPATVQAAPVVVDTGAQPGAGSTDVSPMPGAGYLAAGSSPLGGLTAAQGAPPLSEAQGLSLPSLLAALPGAAHAVSAQSGGESSIGLVHVLGSAISVPPSPSGVSGLRV
jgi:RNA polymerase sigma-70 factor, ECF subfamily